MATIFQSTPSARRATALYKRCPRLLKEFQSTPSARRATAAAGNGGGAAKNFNPRPPRGGRPVNRTAANTICDDFNPRPPRGGRHTPVVPVCLVVEFQSTPSARRATLHGSGNDAQGLISIHALREEGDLRQSTSRHLREEFQSTPSARRATGAGHRPTTHRKISIHALREEGDMSSSGTNDKQVMISIHALREEGDWQEMRQSTQATYFNPRPPRGGRHSTYGQKTSKAKFQSTPSARRATNGQIQIAQAVPISIHALREEGDP